MLDVASRVSGVGVSMCRLPKNFSFWAPNANSPNLLPKVVLHSLMLPCQVAMSIYYAQHNYKDAHGRYAKKISLLVPYVNDYPVRDPEVFLGACSEKPRIETNADASTFKAHIKAKGYRASICCKRILEVRRDIT
mmetsp:Transcript_39600/g.61778  ORF Transcript_39600/g.61778 Transcript_39600/m.61778 type:complete len:135 (-) Transcript_39600:180-584(-)